MDELHRAHLAYLRGDLAETREILDALLAADPTNEEAMNLREAAEAASVERQAAEIRRENWLSLMQPTPIEFLGLALLALALIGLALYSAAEPVRLALAYGLNGETSYQAGVYRIPARVHLLFAIPLLLLAAGLYLGHSCVRYFLDLRASR